MRNRELETASRVMNEAMQGVQKEIAELQAQTDQSFWILRSMAEQVIAADLAGRVVYLNPAAEKAFGVRLRESQGKSFLEVIRQAAINSMLKEVLEKGGEVRQEIRLFLPEETVFEAKALP